MRRYAVLEEFAARAHVVPVPFGRRERPRLEQRHLEAVRVEEHDVVELVVGERRALELDPGPAQRARVIAQPRPHEREPRPGLGPRVQPDRDAAIRQRDVRVRELVADRDGLKAQRAVELERVRERLRGERQLEELSEHQARSRWDVWPQFWQTFAARVGARVKLVSLREPFSPP